MNLRQMTNMKRRIANRTASLNDAYHHLTEERDENNSRIATIRYNPHRSVYELECSVEPKNRRLPMSTPWKQVGEIRRDLTLERVIQLAEKFVDTGKN